MQNTTYNNPFANKFKALIVNYVNFISFKLLNRSLTAPMVFSTLMRYFPKRLLKAFPAGVLPIPLAFTLKGVITVVVNL